MGFQQGLSGVGAAAKQLDVIGNNVANSSTVGFKQSRAEFADMFAAILYHDHCAVIQIADTLLFFFAVFHNKEGHTFPGQDHWF